MNPQAKKRLAIGIVLLTLFCFGLYLYYDNSQSVAVSQTAQLKTESYDVGTPYSGQITEQYIQEGDSVKAGDKLFEIDSSELDALLQDADIQRSSLDIQLNADDEIIIQATKAGVVKSIESSRGSFVPSNTVLATISQTDNLQVEANINLSPDQYAQIDRQSRLVVTLPDGQQVSTPISNTNIINQDDQVIAQLTGDLQDVAYDPLTTKDGAPVNAKLRIATPLWQQIVDAISKLVRDLWP